MLFGLGNLGGILGILPIFSILFVINLVITLFTGGLDDIFGIAQ